jgi:heavy metal sensor kinase
MGKSLRARLLAWYVGGVMLVVALVAVAVCVVTRQSRLAAIDAELQARALRVSSAVRPRADGAFDVELPSDATAYFQQPHPRPYYAVWSGEGLVDRSDPDLGVASAPAPGVRSRGASREVIVAAGDLTILVGRDVTDLRTEIWSLAGTMAVVAAGAMALSLLGAWFVTGRALAPVQRINETARRMAEGDLSARVAVDATDSELGQVASALNLAFDRLLDSIERQRRFTADASHELRTPVAMLMAESDWALLRDRPAGDYRDALETCRRAGTRMRALVEGLLTLARADSGELPVRHEAIQLDEVVAGAIASMAQLARERRVSIRSASTPATVQGDADRLLQLLTTLLVNAVAYNRQEGVVWVNLRTDGAEVVLSVSDSGIGIAADDLPRVFDRFYRGAAARSREPGGAGLGLAVARWIAGAHGGTIACSSEPGHGTEFVVRLPAMEADFAGSVPAGRKPFVTACIADSFSAD